MFGVLLKKHYSVSSFITQELCKISFRIVVSYV